MLRVLSRPIATSKHRRLMFVLKKLDCEINFERFEYKISKRVFFDNSFKKVERNCKIGLAIHIIFFHRFLLSFPPPRTLRRRVSFNNFISAGNIGGDNEKYWCHLYLPVIIISLQKNASAQFFRGIDAHLNE